MSYKKVCVALGASVMAMLMTGCGIMAGGSSLGQGLRTPSTTVDPAPATPPAGNY